MAKTCGVCGAPLPAGNSTFCSDTCCQLWISAFGIPGAETAPEHAYDYPDYDPEDAKYGDPYEPKNPGGPVGTGGIASADPGCLDDPAHGESSPITPAGRQRLREMSEAISKLEDRLQNLQGDATPAGWSRRFADLMVALSELHSMLEDAGDSDELTPFVRDQYCLIPTTCRTLISGLAQLADALDERFVAEGWREE